MPNDAKSTAGFLDDGEELTPELLWQKYEAGSEYNDHLKLPETVKVNENMFIGRQWDGVNANGLPTPVFNFLKQTVMFKVSTITSDNMKVNVEALSGAPKKDELIQPAQIVSDQFDALMEQNRVLRLNRELCRDAAVRGDGCLYTYFDPEAPSGAMLGQTPVKGRIVTEVLQNTRVFFGDPNERSVQKQPYVILKTFVPARKMRRIAQKNGASNWEEIEADQDEKSIDDAKKTDDKVTDLLLLWKDEDSGTIWGYEATQKCVIREPFDLGIRLYPLVWLNWDYVQDCYHGQAEVTGLIPNQVAYNRVWAASILSILSTAFPRLLYDPTRIKKWTNQIGAAMKCIGGDLAGATKNIDPATISPQVYQYLEGLVSQTQKCMGVTAVAMGDSNPYNTSAIIALQRAATTPMELTKLNDYEGIEDLFRIYLEFMIANYGKRDVTFKTPDALKEAYEFAANSHPEAAPQEYTTQTFDFSTLGDIPWNIRLDVGASSYFSEISAVTTLGEWMKIGAITPLQCAERLPKGYMPKLDELVSELREKQKQQEEALAQEQQQAVPQEAPKETPQTLPQPSAQADGKLEGGAPDESKIPVQAGPGNRMLQRAVTKSAELP